MPVVLILSTGLHTVFVHVYRLIVYVSTVLNPFSKTWSCVELHKYKESPSKWRKQYYKKIKKMRRAKINLQDYVAVSTAARYRMQVFSAQASF